VISVTPSGKKVIICTQVDLFRHQSARLSTSLFLCLFLYPFSPLQILGHAQLPGQHPHLHVSGGGYCSACFLWCGEQRLDLLGISVLWDNCHKVRGLQSLQVVRNLRTQLVTSYLLQNALWNALYRLTTDLSAARLYSKACLSVVKLNLIPIVVKLRFCTQLMGHQNETALLFHD
jgi:hypothetical protein